MLTTSYGVQICNKLVLSIYGIDRVQYRNIACHHFRSFYHWNAYVPVSIVCKLSSQQSWNLLVAILLQFWKLKHLCIPIFCNHNFGGYISATMPQDCVLFEPIWNLSIEESILFMKISPSQKAAQRLSCNNPICSIPAAMSLPWPAGWMQTYQRHLRGLQIVKWENHPQNWLQCLRDTAMEIEMCKNCTQYIQEYVCLILTEIDLLSCKQTECKTFT